MRIGVHELFSLNDNPGGVMQKPSRVKFYLLNVFAMVSLFSPLLPWMSYGVGSKTGIDIAIRSTYIIAIASIGLLLISFLLFKTTTMKKFFLILALMFSGVIFSIYLYEIVRIAYQTTIANSLPVEMFGVVSLSAKEIHIGYGLWLGVGISFLSLLLNFIAMRAKGDKT